VYNYSKIKYDFGLCKNCQDWYRDDKSTTIETKRLYLALKTRNLPVEIEKNDGYKTIDLSIPTQKVNIEVDGSHHNFDSKQALSDLMRTYYSFEKGFHTFRIPNTLIKKHLDQTADSIIDIILINKANLEKEKNLESMVDDKAKFEELIANFMLYFYHVFEMDWDYTYSYIAQGNFVEEGLLSEFLDESNWNNRDQLVKYFREIIQHMNDKEIFSKIFKKQQYNDMLTALFCDRYGINRKG